MPTYVLMTKLSPSTVHAPKGRKPAGQQWQKKVEREVPGIRWISHYALIGPYDFSDAYEAPEDRNMMLRGAVMRLVPGRVY